MKKYFVEIMWETYVFENLHDATTFLDITTRMKKVKRENYDSPYRDIEEQQMLVNRLQVADYEPSDE